MSEMLEKVARRLAETRVYGGYNAETRARLIEKEMYGAERDVRLVLEALREPSEGMKDAGGSALECAMDLLPHTGNEDAADIYRAMIDHVLKGGKP